ncbi:MAG: hypothetical protein KTR31_41735 [Myxococcales bacterium]|nr:hypothetical protein [Myxococcales bacterium]
MPTVLRGLPLLLSVVACRPPAGPDQPWSGDTPEGAVMVTQEELEALRASGTLHNIHPDERAEVRDRQRARRDADEALVAATLAELPSLQRHLQIALPDGAAQRPDGTVEMTRDNGDVVVLMGRDQAVGDLAATLRSRDDAHTQRTLLRTLHPAAPPECRGAIAAPETWEEMQAPDLLNAVQTLSACAADIIDHQPDHPSMLPDAPRAAWPYQAPRPASDQLTDDVDPGCYDADGNPMASSVVDLGSPVVAPYLPEVRDQARRGTCAAFATVSALELYVARIYGRPTNLSEQSIYALAKALWYDEWDDDGLPTAHFLDDLSESGTAVPFEPTWTYNPSRQILPLLFLQACNGYDGVMCAENAPQTQRICVEQAGLPYCFVWMPSFADGYSMPVSASAFIHFEGDFHALNCCSSQGTPPWPA